MQKKRNRIIFNGTEKVLSPFKDDKFPISNTNIDDDDYKNHEETLIPQTPMKIFTIKSNSGRTNQKQMPQQINIFRQY